VNASLARHCSLAALAAGLVLAPVARADSAGPTLSARVTCAPAKGPGRILCDLAVSAPSGKLVWVDVLVVKAPPFARPLRSRVVAQLGALGTASAKLALVASELGKGELELRVRSVLCHEGPNGEWCGPEVAPISGLVEVGQSPPPGAAPAP
jgi:hypothetical protein